MAGFKYRRPSETDIQRRVDQSLGSYEGFLKDEYQKYSPKKGDNAIRILPRDASEEAQHYGEDVWVHYNVGPDKASVLCPSKMAGEPCPVCEERARAERRGDEQAANDMKPNRRVIMWILDRKDEQKGPVVFDCPPTVDQGIAKQARDRETGRFIFIDDPEQGHDVYFDREGEGMTTKYGGFQIAKKATSVDPRVLQFIVDNPLLETLRVRSYDEIRALFEGGAVAKPSEDEVEPAAKTRPTLTRAVDRSAAQEDHRRSAPEPEPEPEPEPREEQTPREEAPPKSGLDRAASLRARFAARNK